MTNKIVLVTGANSGIGEATAAAFVQAGATVYGLARRKDALEAARIKHPKIRWVLGDLSGAVFAGIERLDVLVNNAAVFEFGPLEASSEQMIRTQVETNIVGLALMTKAALPLLKASRGMIINISSAAGHKAVPGGSIYGATKAAVESLTKSWALELAPAGIRVNAIAPGPTETAGFDKISSLRESFVSQVPLGRMATSDEIATWILHVAAESWMTGHILAIDGGMSLS